MLSAHLRSSLKILAPLLLTAVVGIAIGLAFDTLAKIPLKWFIAAFVGGSFMVFALASVHTRSIFLFCLVVSIAIDFNTHLTYRPHIGVADGITIDLVDIWLALGIIAWLRDYKYGLTDIHFFPQTSIAFLVLISCGLLSVLNSRDLELSAYGLFAIVKEFALYWFIANTVRTPKELRTILFALGFAAFIIGIVCIVQTALQINFTSALKIIDQDPYDHPTFRAVGLSTATGTGGYLAGSLLFLVPLLFLAKTRLEQLFVIVALGTGTVGLVLTLTRGAWICMAIGALPIVYYYYRFKLINTAQLLIPIAIVMLLAFVFQDMILARLSEGSGNALARYGLLLTAFNMIQEHFLMGIGLNTYVLEMDRFSPDFEIHHFRYMVHNGYILRFAEMGVFAFTSLLAILFIALYRVWVLIRTADNMTTIAAVGLLGSLLAIMLNMNLEPYSGGFLMQQLWLVIGSIVALDRFRLGDSA